MGQFEVTVGAGSFRSDGSDGSDGPVRFPHRWTDEGVTVDAEFTGAHLLHLAAAGCVLNDLYREAAALDVPLDGVRVRASGDYDTDTWASTGIEYTIEVDSSASAEQLAHLLKQVDDVAEIPKAIRAGAAVHRAP